MSEDTNTARTPVGPPWIRPERQKDIVWRDGDIVISVPAKSGTTWTMNIVHQLLSGGDADFRDVYAEVPWIEFVAHPEEAPEALHDRIGAMPRDRRRAFKTHSAPPVLPYIAGEGAPRVKYVVVARNPEEAIVSFWPFLGKHSSEWITLWGLPPEVLKRNDFATFYADHVATGMHEHGFYGFIEAWWPLRDNPNVLFLHYTDMKRDHEGSIRRIATFLEIEPDDAQWERILEYMSFAWMKAHEEKFEGSTTSETRILERGAMIRRGETGAAHSDGMTEAIAAELRAIGERVCSDPRALQWYYSGGVLP